MNSPTGKPTYIISLEMTGDIEHIYNAYEDIVVHVPIDNLEFAGITIYPVEE